MAIIIKEITIKTTIEEHHSVSVISENQKKQLKAEIINEVKNLFKKTTFRNIKR